MYFLAYYDKQKNITITLCNDGTRLLYFAVHPYSSTYDSTKFDDIKYQPFPMKDYDNVLANRELFIDYFQEDYDNECLMIINNESGAIIHYYEYLFSIELNVGNFIARKKKDANPT